MSIGGAGAGVVCGFCCRFWDALRARRDRASASYIVAIKQVVTIIVDTF